MADDGYIETKHLCKCGSKLMLINDSEFYDDDIAQCDQCLHDIPKNESFFHCNENSTNNSLTIHPDGYDLCKQCVLLNQNVVQHNDTDTFTADDLILVGSPTIASPKVIKTEKEKKSKKDKKDKKSRKDRSRRSSKDTHKKDKDRDKNKSNCKMDGPTKKLKKEKLLLMKEIQDKDEKIKFLESQLELIKKDKLENDTTLKLVKNQVNELILKNEELNRELMYEKKQNAKFQPDAQWKLLCQLQTNFKSLKSKQSKGGKQIEQNCKKIKKMEEILGNMYQVFNNKFEKQQIEIKKSVQQTNLQLDDIDKELSELEKDLSENNSDS